VRLSAALHQKKYETRYGLCYQSLGHQSLDDQRFTYEDWINQFETYTQTDKRTTITDIHASKIDEETCVKVGLYPPCLT
jgi:hypothetical protein